MNIEMLKSGSYRIRQTIDGKTYRLTIDHYPSDKEALRLISEKMAEKGVVSSVKMTFKSACTAYIKSKANVISPTTIRGYNSILNAISIGFKDTFISEITLPMVQAEINSYSVNRSPKSVYNMSGFIMGVLNYYGIDIKSPRLPQKEKKSPYIPTENEVKAVFDALKGSKYEVPILLCAMGLRRSEVCALTPEDLNGNVLTINKAKVLNPDKQWVIKATKTTESTRQITLPDYLVKIINERGFYTGDPGWIRKHLLKVLKDLGIEKFTPHKLRHFYASYLHSLGYSDKQIQAMGGWKTDSVMKTVYQHAMDMEEAKSKAASDLGSLM